MISFICNFHPLLIKPSRLIYFIVPGYDNYTIIVLLSIMKVNDLEKCMLTCINFCQKLKWMTYVCDYMTSGGQYKKCFTIWENHGEYTAKTFKSSDTETWCFFCDLFCLERISWCLQPFFFFFFFLTGICYNDASHFKKIWSKSIKESVHKKSSQRIANMDMVVNKSVPF